MQEGGSGLRWKFSLLLSGIVLFVMAFLSVGDYLWQRRAFLDNLNAHIVEEARLVAFLVSREVLFSHGESPQPAQRLLRDLHQFSEPADYHIGAGHVIVVQEDGVIIAADSPSLVGKQTMHEGLIRVLSGSSHQQFGIVQDEEYPYYYGAVSLTLPSGERLAVQVTEPYASIQAKMRAFLRQRLLFMLAITAVLILATLTATHRIILTPLEHLAKSIERVSQKDLDARVEIQRQDELGAIGRAFNRMIDALKKAQQQSEAEKERLTLLYHINRRLASVSDWDTLVDLVLHIPSEFLPVGGTLFLSYSEHTRRFHLEGAWGISETALAILEQRLLSIENPACLSCPPRMAHTEQNCPLLVPGLLCSPCDRMVCIHLAQGSRTVGFLYVLIPEDAVLPPEKVQLLNAVSGEIAAAVAVAQARARELALLANMEKAQPTPTTIHETLQHILTWTLEASQAERGIIFLYEQETHHLYPAVWHGIPAEDIDAWRGLAHQGIHQETPVILSRRPISARETEHVALIPLRLRDQAVGALILATDQRDTYTKDHITFLSAIASQMALIIETSRLYERLEQQAILEERARLSRELHDGLAQSLAFARMKLWQIEQWLAQGNSARVNEEVRLVKQVIEEAYLDVRESIEGLRLPLDKKETFGEILQAYAERFTQRAGIPVHVHVENVDLPPGPQVQLLRVVQEALTNVRKHANASHVVITLQQENGHIRLSIEDDGTGFTADVERSPRQFGLQIMAERVETLGGHLSVQSQPGRGTRVEVLFPCPQVPLLDLE